MKTSGWVASAVGAVVVVGGGIWGVQALTADPGGETHTVDDYTPDDVTESPEASAEPTEPVETPTVEPSEAPEPVEPTPESTEAPGAEDAFLEAARIYPAMEDLDMSDAEILEAGWQACDYVAEYGTTNLPDEIWVIDSGSAGIRNSFTATADELLCG